MGIRKIVHSGGAWSGESSFLWLPREIADLSIADNKIMDEQWSTVMESAVRRRRPADGQQYPIDFSERIVGTGATEGKDREQF